MLHRIMLDVELGIVGIQKKTELPISDESIGVIKYFYVELYL